MTTLKSAMTTVTSSGDAVPSRLGGDVGWSTDGHHLGVVLLLAYAACTCFLGLRSGAPMGDHECINALAARDVLQGGDFLIPKVGDVARIRKTPLGVWLITLSSWMVGVADESPHVTAFSARLPSAMAGLGLVVVLLWLGSMLFGRRAGLVCGFIGAGCAAVVVYSRNAQVDLALTFFTTLAFACFWRGAMGPTADRRFLAAFYVAFSLAMMAKAPLPLAIVGLSLAAFWFVTLPLNAALEDAGGEPLLKRVVRALGAQIGKLRGLWLAPGVALFVVLVGAWPVWVTLKVDNALALWKIEYLSRFTGELSDRAKAWWYYVPMVFGLTLPYCGSIPEAVVAPFLPRFRAQRRGLLFALTWAVVGTAFLSASAFKRPHYLLSVVPAYCLLLGPVVDRLFFAASWEVTRLVRITCLLLPIGLLGGGIAGIVVLARTYPALTWVGGIAIALAVLVWSAACWAYARRCRLTSFALLHLGVPLLVVSVWPTLDTGAGLNAESNALARELHAHHIAEQSSIHWVEGQQSFTVWFYHGFRMDRLIDEVEMASLREGRRDVSSDVYQAVVDRLKTRLKEDPPAYFVVSAGTFDQVARRTDLHIREVFRLSGFHEDAEDELVLFTRSDG